VQGIHVTSSSEALAEQQALPALLQIMAVVFVAFLVIGLGMPVLPLHVHDRLGLGTFVVGLVAGSQFAVALVSRPSAGHYSDNKGPKRGVVTGLVVAAMAGLLYLSSLLFIGSPGISVAVLLLGRTLLGGAESFIITAAVSWGLSIASPRSTGKVIAWVGAAMFAAFAIGAPIGSLLYARYGFWSVAVATILAPAATLLLVAPLASVAPIPGVRSHFAKVARAVWVPGFASALSSVGFGALTAFITLLFANRGWEHGWLAYSAFAAAFILARLFFGHLPDKLGGARVAVVCSLIEAAGQVLIWMAPTPELALAGAVLTGFGYSLVYPGLGIEAVRRAPPQSRGLAMGAYTAFLDLALGFGTPVLGLIAGWTELNFVFLAGGIAALGTTSMALRLGFSAHAHQPPNRSLI
jgi:MFS family permease